MALLLVVPAIYVVHKQKGEIWGGGNVCTKKGLEKSIGRRLADRLSWKAYI